MAFQWYIESDGQKQGPYSSPDLKRFANSGKLTPGHHIWRDGLPAWIEAGTVDGLFSVVLTTNPNVQPPPLPKKTVPRPLHVTPPLPLQRVPSTEESTPARRPQTSAAKGQRPPIAFREVGVGLVIAVVGAVLGYIASYFFQSGLLRLVYPLGTYIDAAVFVLFGDGNGKMDDLRYTAWIGVLGGAVLALCLRYWLAQLKGHNQGSSPVSKAPRIRTNTNQGPWRFKVYGVHPTSKHTTSWYFEADSQEDAQAKAEFEGIDITRVVQERED